MAGANTRQTREAFKVVGPLKSLVAASAVGSGTAFSLGGGFNTFGVQLVGTGTTSATVALQGAIASSAEAGTTAVWKTLGSAVTFDSTLNGAITRSTSAVPVCHVRLRITAITTGTSTATDALSGWISVL